MKCLDLFIFFLSPQPVFIYLFLLFDHLDRHEYIFPFFQAITVWYKPPPNDHLINEPIRKS